MARALVIAISLLVCGASFTLASRARADEKRQPIDYDGREEPTTAGDVLIWIPRVALSPLYLVSEYVVRRPLGFLIAGAERANLPEILYDIFAFGPDHSIGIYPIAFIDFGFDPSVGLYFFWNDALAKDNDFRLRASIWADDWRAVRLTDRLKLSSINDETTLGLDASLVRRPDYVFYGIGPRTLESDISRFSATRLEARMALDYGFWRSSRLTSSFGVRSVRFDPGNYGDDPTVQEHVAAGVFAQPDRLSEGYMLLYSRAELAIDSRCARPCSGSGVRLEAQLEHDADVRDPSASGFVRYGGSVGGFYDLAELHRVVSLSVTTLFVDPLADSAVPFTELASVGGDFSMRGFVPGRLVDRSAAFATLRYRWPIWIFLDGSVQLAVGNVFGEHLKGLSPSLLRYSGAIGIESVGSPDSSLELLVGVGSETFGDGGEISSVRFVVGTNHGF